jgi:hypothetical protein
MLTLRPLFVEGDGTLGGVLRLVDIRASRPSSPPPLPFTPKKDGGAGISPPVRGRIRFGLISASNRRSSLPRFWPANVLPKGGSRGAISRLEGRLDEPEPRLTPPTIPADVESGGG